MYTCAHIITYCVIFYFIRPNFGVNVKEECIDVWSMICHCLGSMLEDVKKDKSGYVAPAMKLGICICNSICIYGETCLS